MHILLFFLNAVCYAGQSATGKLYAAKGGKTRDFNICKASSAMVFFLLWLILQGFSFHTPTMLYGMLYGILLTVSMHFGFLALSIGPMALTSMMAAMSLLIPLGWGILFWNESLTLFNTLGILLLICAIALICSPRKGKFSKKWLIYSLITLIANGGCSLIQKYHQAAFPGQYTVSFMFFSMLTVTVCLLLMQLCRKHISFRPNLLGTASGIMNGLTNFVVLLLAATENAAQLFPLVSAVNVMAAYLTGLLLFREKVKFLQIIGLLAGIAGVILLNVK